MITLITGGIKSGKSDFALCRAEKTQKKNNFCFIATALPVDEEIRKRIEKHRKKRKKFWKTIEEPENIDKVFQTLPQKSTVLVDCVTLWAGNIICRPEMTSADLEKAEKKIDKIISVIKEKDMKVFFITNEVGCGIIPENKLSRGYIDFLGKINQKIARSADEVYLMVAGIDLKVKGKQK